MTPEEHKTRVRATAKKMAEIHRNALKLLADGVIADAETEAMKLNMSPEAMVIFGQIPSEELPRSDEEFEDLIDNIEADLAMKDAEQYGTLSWEEVKKRLNLTPPSPPESR